MSEAESNFRRCMHALVADGILPCCLHLSSVFQDIRLRDLSDFQTMAPEELRTEETLNDPHKLMLARLEYELLERQQ